MMHQIIVQGIGLLGFLLFFLSFQRKTRLSILYLHGASMVVYSIHYFLLGAFAAVAMTLLNVLRTVLFAMKGKYPWIGNRWVLYAFLALFIGAGVIFWEGYRSLALIVALCFVTVSHWQQDTKKLRILFAVSNPLWIVYDVLVGSYAGIFSEVVFLLSNAVGYARFESKKKERV